MVGVCQLDAFGSVEGSCKHPLGSAKHARIRTGLRAVTRQYFHCFT